MTKQQIATAIHYLRRVVPHGPQETTELLNLIRQLESMLD